MAVNLFDANFYRSVNPDLAGLNDAQAYQHLISFGLNEGRTFSLYVDLNTYRVSNTDLAAAGLITNQQLYDHLSISGAAEGRNFSPVFNANVYRALNPDLQAAGLNNEQLLDHFRAFGINEGRQASNSFSVGFYLAANPDLQAAGFNNQQALQHYVFFGIAEGRIAAPGGGVKPVIQAPQNAGDPFPPGGTTLNASSNLGVINGSFSLTDFVGTDDPNDYYRFVLENNSEFDLTLGALTGDATVRLIKDYSQNGEFDDGDGDVFSGDSGSSSENAKINQALAAGTYFIEVSPYYSSGKADYDLRLNVTPKPGNTAVDPGNTLSTPLDIGFINGEINFKEFVGETDPNDVYRFNLSNNSDIKLTLSSLTDRAHIELIQDKNGNGRTDQGDGDLLGSDDNYSNSNGYINTALQAGTYLIRIYTYSSLSGVNTNYSLTISTQPSAEVIKNNSNIDIIANIDPLTNSSTVNELPASADFGNVSLIQQFTGNSAVELGNVASNQLPNTTQDLIGDGLGIGSDFGSGFSSNLLDNANFNSTLSLL
ncbi:MULTISPECIES: PPC domain-containing protein [Planktothricoides]|uniref:PPC domain-containing protein n=1 Tax=Planktothricoides raciborskii FACHB-1370 TaxID=2949576 RepID=A0ABR8EJ48_9CYAN|nr:MULTISPECIES: PPC domain-containing protein [Planktothricoides]MBD2545582.1 PPC domain-containing protein [Planktothricoides raciborskii FACHB-1370]MBD2583488.1 PPC domain-containing protein [Planktothricoides raciborskii FACHB-1261]